LVAILLEQDYQVSEGDLTMACIQACPTLGLPVAGGEILMVVTISAHRVLAMIPQVHPDLVEGLVAGEVGLFNSSLVT
jgi:hypothetical protein